MFLLWIIIIIIVLFFITKNYENFSGGTNIQLNSNDASPTETTLTQYRPYWLSTFYKENPTSELELSQTVLNDFDNNFNNNLDINENFSCNKCKNNRKYKLYNINDYIVSNNYEQIKM
jgi:hypothetical protein